MGSIPLEALLPAPEVSCDDAREIGSMPVRSTPTAMRVGYAGGNGRELIYLGETPIFVANVPRCVCFMQEGQKRTARWWRLEVKVDESNGWIKRGHELVVAEHPYANGWTHHALFKPRYRGDTLVRPDPTSMTFEGASELEGWVEELSHDFWDTGKYLTAGILAPNFPQAEDSAIREVQATAFLVFGTCENFRAYESELFKAEAVQKLLRETEQGNIRFGPPGCRATLYEETKAERNALMLLSIRQALAGPHKDSDNWVERPVTRRVDGIYRWHLNNWNRRIAREHGKLVYTDEKPNQFFGLDEPRPVRGRPPYDESPTLVVRNRLEGEMEQEQPEGFDEEQSRKISEKLGIREDIFLRIWRRIEKKYSARTGRQMAKALQAEAKRYADLEARLSAVGANLTGKGSGPEAWKALETGDLEEAERILNAIQARKD